ncbi:DUF397 domain-containing protein [Actinomadura roseirufa]|uniref:DUF397 domain-containing protein n=1 Tax=Actinomadura roseirufa TaxID=2094049 RepID=UPI00104149E9|nr:DUF397 domain-containing protein [Actinomadura roseirufa]
MWRKSSYSDSSGNNCVEVADLGREVGLRDSTDPEGPKLMVGRDHLADLLSQIKAGEHEL